MTQITAERLRRVLDYDAATGNNTSGFKGVYWDRRRQKWYAQIGINRRGKSLGYFETAKLAAEAYRAKAREVFGAFAHAE